MNKKNRKRTSSKLFRRVSLIAVIGIAASLAVAATTVITRQRRATATSNPAKTTGNHFVTVKVAGRDVQFDPQTGQIKPLTADEAQQLAAGLKTMLNKSTDGLVQEQHPDGTVSMDLQGRFQNVAVAKVNADGTLSQSCVDNPEAAASFFGIDPQLLGAEQKPGSVNQTTRIVNQKVTQQ